MGWGSGVSHARWCVWGQMGTRGFLEHECRSLGHPDWPRVRDGATQWAAPPPLLAVPPPPPPVRVWQVKSSPRSPSGAEDDNQQLLAQVAACRNERGLSCNPQFEEVLRLLVPERQATAVVELVNTQTSRSMRNVKTDVVARFDVTIGDASEVPGPFTFHFPEPASFGRSASAPADVVGTDGGCGAMVQLHGTLALCPLVATGPGTKEMRDSPDGFVMIE